MTQFVPATKSAVVFVEGYDDQQLIETILNEENLSDSVQLIRYAEFSKLGRYLDLFVRDESFVKVTRIGLTNDADDAPQAALQSLEGAWQMALRAINEVGRQTPIQQFFVMPDNANAGRIENLCLQSPRFPEILLCANELLACARRVAPYPIDPEKSTISAYLSMMRRNGLRLGTGAQAGCWDLRSDAFGPLRRFVISMGS